MNGEGTILRHAVLSDAQLNDADLSEADLTDAILRAANLSGADLRRANLKFANFTSYELAGMEVGHTVVTLGQVHAAKNWQKAYYDPDVLKELYPSSNESEKHNDELQWEQMNEEYFQGKLAADVAPKIQPPQDGPKSSQ